MELQNVEYLYQVSRRKIDAVKTVFHRSLYEKINWDNRLIGIKGCKGVGKTTMLLQYIKESIPDKSKVLYVSLDNIWFESNSLVSLVEYHYTHGGSHVFLDEIHYLHNWQTILKNLYDDYPDLKICYTGSSMLKIDTQGKDLSRRQRVYELPRLSFREFLEMEGLYSGPSYGLQELLDRHTDIAANIVSHIKVLPAFENYLQHGCYPFYQEEGDGFLLRLQDAVRMTLENDLPQLTDISFSTIQKIKQMLMILAARVPQTPNMSMLYSQLETNREQGLKMLYLLEQAGLLILLTRETKSLKHLPKPDKLYLGDCNLMFALSPRVDTGTLRETFFSQQLQVENELILPSAGDFLVNGEWLFEVGGKGKDFSQIKDIKESFLAVDDIEIGHHNRIPLWLFGFLY